MVFILPISLIIKAYRYSEYIGDDFIEFGENIGLNKKVILQKLIPEITKEKVESVYQHSFMPQSHIETVLKTYRKRLTLLEYERRHASSKSWLQVNY
ncbi:hypothetical protein BKK51_10530 [Rodentibacter trehalosifermentans]|uniref:Uncharacterized protein n=1 Tax=Rodentibacter trehalosifermentans TaxID=1908263 RepID=A0A1V3INW9_9PAST|nr:hypothetical protein BKK51_10530 [Rodentibacter trehalosifermentans]OOF47387.1 hypothetical protein BKK52_09265 [Rodentibacter trehalosifermentans]